MLERPIQIAVIGGRTASEDELKLAEETGKLIAGRGYQLICGGLGGIMEAACRGAFEAGGMTIGILPEKDRCMANEFVKVSVASGIGVARNSILAHSADAAIAISGQYGTLSEIAYFLQFDKPVVLLSCQWQIPGATPVATPKDAIETIEEQLS